MYAQSDLIYMQTMPNIMHINLASVRIFSSIPLPLKIPLCLFVYPASTVSIKWFHQSWFYLHDSRLLMLNFILILKLFSCFESRTKLWSLVKSIQLRTTDRKIFW